MEDCLKRRFGQLADVIGGLPKNRGLYFLKGWYANAQYGYKKQVPKY